MDGKLALQGEFRFDGSKGGVQWKGKLERYLISRVPVLKELLEWVEGEDLEVVTVERLKEAVGARLDENQLLSLNGAIWGFLSSALSGSAETIFKRAETLNGLDAWRRVTRHIDHGRSIRLEALRREVKTMHLRPMRNLDGVEEGIAEFENLLKECGDAGGTPFGEEEKKADLLAILPSEIKEHLLWHATDISKDFAAFRDIVLTQTAKILMTRKKLPIHAVVNEAGADDEEEEPDLSEITCVDDLIAVLNRMNGRRNGPGRRQQLPQQRRERQGGPGVRQGGPGVR